MINSSSEKVLEAYDVLSLRLMNGEVVRCGGSWDKLDRIQDNEQTSNNGYECMSER